MPAKRPSTFELQPFGPNKANGSADYGFVLRPHGAAPPAYELAHSSKGLVCAVPAAFGDRPDQLGHAVMHPAHCVGSRGLRPPPPWCPSAGAAPRTAAAAPWAAAATLGLVGCCSSRGGPTQRPSRPAAGHAAVAPNGQEACHEACCHEACFSRQGTRSCHEACLRAPENSAPLGAALQVATAVASSQPSSNASTTARASSAEAGRAQAAGKAPLQGATAVRGTLSEVRSRPLPDRGDLSLGQLPNVGGERSTQNWCSQKPTPIIRRLV